MRVARVDPALAVRIVATRLLRYSAPANADDDRSPHVRAGSGLAHAGGRLVVIQDDTAFIATVAGDAVAAIPLPRGPGGRRRFEVAFGNKHDKLDLESCVAVDGAVWAFGSGSSTARERIVVVGGERAVVIDAAPLYRRLREQLDGDINIEGAAVVRDELWLFHRGNTGPRDRGPATVRLDRVEVASWLGGRAALPEVRGSTRFDLGAIDGVRYGFTDAVAVADRVFYLAAAEASQDAIADGPVLGCMLGVIDGAGVRAAELARGGQPIKAEGLAFDPADPSRAWIVLDPDDVDRPAELCELALTGPW